MKIATLALLSATLCAAFGPRAEAAVIAGTFKFGTGGDTASFPYNDSPIAGVTVGDLIKVGVTTSSSAGNFRATVWPTGATTGSETFAGTLDLGKYFEFSLAPDPGNILGMTSISFGVGRSATGPRQWEWRSSVDGYAAAIDSYTALNSGLTLGGGVLTNPDLNSAWEGNVLDLSGPQYDGLSGVTFRLYGFNAEGTGGTGGLQGNLSFLGEVLPVPEPANALATLAFVASGLLLRRRTKLLG